MILNGLGFVSAILMPSLEVTQPTPQATAESGNKAIASSAQLTRWLTSDPSNSVASFYVVSVLQIL